MSVKIEYQGLEACAKEVLMIRPWGLRQEGRSGFASLCQVGWYSTSRLHKNNLRQGVLVRNVQVKKLRWSVVLCEAPYTAGYKGRVTAKVRFLGFLVC